MGLFGSLGGVNSALAGTASKYGTSEMEVPEYKPVSVAQAQSNALGANLANWNDITTITKAANKLGGDELIAGMERISPGITQTMGQSTKVMQSWLKGELPQDVQDSIINAGAASGVEGGFAGSSFGRNLVARDLGLTSLNLMDKGLTAAERWTSMIGQMTPKFDYSGLMVTPSQALQVDEFNTQNQWNRDWLANQVESLGSPMDQALNNMFVSFGNTADSYTGLAFGGIGGAGGGTTNQGWGKSMADGTV